MPATGARAVRDCRLSDFQDHDRPPGVFGWIISHPKTTALISVVVFLLLLVLLFQSVAESRLERQIAAIRARGEPTCAEDLAAARPRIPDDENMTVLILAQAQRIKSIHIPEERSRDLPIIGPAVTPPAGRRTPPNQLDAAKWYLAQCPEELGNIHEALELTRGCSNMNFTSPLYDVRLRSLSEFRLAAKVLALDSLVAAEDGDEERAGERALALCRFSRAMEHESFLIGLLVRISIDDLACSRIERTVNVCGLSDEALRLLQVELGSADRIPDFRWAMMVERVIFLDTMQWLRQGGSPAMLTGGGSSPLKAWSYVPILSAVDTAAGLRICNEMIEAIDEPDADSIQRVTTVRSKTANPPKYAVISRMMLPGLERATVLWVRGVAANRAMRAALACERHRLARGEWPGDLEALVPEYLETVPLDPFDGQAIRYKQIPEGVCVWSVGEDMVDNGGDVMRLEIPTAKRRATDFGWVLLNPDLRGLPAEVEENQAQPTTASSPAE